MKRFVIVLVAAVLLAALVGGCAAPAPTPSKPATTTPAAAPSPAATPTPTPTPKPTPTPTPTLSKTLFSIAMPGGITGTIYAVMTTWVNPIKKAIGLDMKPAPVTGDMDSITSLTRGSVDFVSLSPAAGLDGFYGTGLAANAGLKPIPELRQVWLVSISDIGIAVRADSDIKTIYDLKGKVMAIAPNSATTVERMKGIAAFINADFDSFKKVNASSTGGMFTLVKNGAADFGIGGVSSTSAIEMAASPHGLRWIPMPFSDKEGWKRFMAVTTPGAQAPYLIEQGNPNLPPGGLEGMGSSQVIYTLASQDPNLVYTLAKGLTLAYPDFKDLHPINWQATVQRSSDLGLMVRDIPYHEGVIKWFKEKGLWSAEKDKEQQARLKAIGAAK